MVTVQRLEPGQAVPPFAIDHFSVVGRRYALELNGVNNEDDFRAACSQLSSVSIASLITIVRHDIGRIICRKLLTEAEAEQLVWGYRKWADPREVYAAMHQARHEYGDHHKQRWYALRDLVLATRDIRRRRPRCAFCKRRFIPSDPQDARREFFTIIAYRHFFELPRTDSPRVRQWHMYWFQDNLHMSKDMETNLHWYFRENTARVCGPACEAARYSRWWAELEDRNRREDKERRRYRKEKQWLKIARTELRNVRQILHPGVWPSPAKESRPASTSRAS